MHKIKKMGKKGFFIKTEKSKLLNLTDRLQKQNEVLMLPAEPRTKQTWWQRITGK